MADSKNVDERCVLCLDQKRFPVSIDCGHSFCYGCLAIYKTYKKYAWANKCPICRDEFKEKKKPAKRKHSDENMTLQTSHLSSVAAYQNTSAVSSLSLTSQHNNNNNSNNSLDEFISMATNYLTDSQNESDDFLDSYENMDHSVQNYTMSDELFSTPHSQADDQTTYEELDFLTDSQESYDNYYDNENEHDGSTDQYYYEDNVFSSYEPSRTHEHFEGYSENYLTDDADEVTSFLNVDDDAVTYDVDRSDIDWETVIATDVIIID